MAYRCPDCAKFVSVELQVEVDNCELEADDSGSHTVRAQTRLVLTCADCGNEVAEANAEAEEEFEHNHEEDLQEAPGSCAEWDADEALELTDDCPEGEPEERWEGKGRYAKHFYGAAIPVEIKCKTCGAEFGGTIHVEEQASSFESLC